MAGKAAVAQSMPIQVCTFQSSLTPREGFPGPFPFKGSFILLLVTSWYSHQSPSGPTDLPHMWAPLRSGTKDDKDLCSQAPQAWHGVGSLDGIVGKASFCRCY